MLDSALCSVHAVDASVRAARAAKHLSFRTARCLRVLGLGLCPLLFVVGSGKVLEGWHLLATLGSDTIKLLYYGSNTSNIAV